MLPIMAGERARTK